MKNIFILLAVFIAVFFAPEATASSAASPAPVPSEEEMENGLWQIVIVEQFDLDLQTPAKSGTPSFSREEVQKAKDIVRERLKVDGLDKYEPLVRLVDNKNQDKIMVIFIGVFDDRVLPNGEMLRREYHIHNGKVFRIVKSYPDGKRVYIDIDTAADDSGGRQ